MKRAALVAWIGLTDLRASRGELRDGVGPIAQAVQQRSFDEIHLLSDHKSSDSGGFVGWLKEKTGKTAKIWNVKLKGPTRFSDIYEAATSVLGALVETDAERQLTFHVSTGNPGDGSCLGVACENKIPR